MFINFTNTGCLLYPVVLTCFENIQWALPLDHISKMNDWYELWSKAGANPNFRVQNPEQYIFRVQLDRELIDKYFFNKVFDFILGLFRIDNYNIFVFPKIKKKV